MSEPESKPGFLDSGVASDVRVVDTSDGRIVVKQALPKLKVDADWYSDPARSLVEVAAIEAFASLGGAETVPELVWVRPEENCFAMRLVDPRLRNWKADLMAGRVDPVTAARVGEILGAFHRKSSARPDLKEKFANLRYFHELRVEPFFNYVAAQKPQFAERIAQVLAGILERRSALVHGDYSPKNILADGADVVILDFEVTHWGDPRFDVAFCLAHLILKSDLFRDSAAGMAKCIANFLGAYAKTGLQLCDAHLAHITGCLLFARLYGKSPVEYRSRLDIGSIERKAKALLDACEAPTLSSFSLHQE